MAVVGNGMPIRKFWLGKLCFNSEDVGILTTVDQQLSSQELGAYKDDICFKAPFNGSGPTREKDPPDVNDDRFYFPGVPADPHSLEKLLQTIPRMFDIPDNYKNNYIGCTFDVLSILGQGSLFINTGPGPSVERISVDYLKNKKYVAFFCFYIPVLNQGYPFCMCHTIIQTFKQLISEGKSDFEFVLVPAIRPDIPSLQDPEVGKAAFHHFISGFPGFLALPFWEHVQATHLLLRLSATYKYDSPGCFIVDLEDQKVVYTHLYAFSVFGAYFYPFTHATLSHLWEEMRKIGCEMPLEALLGCETTDVLNRLAYRGVGETMSSLKSKVIWIYFLGDRQRLDIICDMYKQCKLKHVFELILVTPLCSTHKSRQMSWDDYRLPLLDKKECWDWLELPPNDEISRRLCQFSGSTDHDKLLVVEPGKFHVERNAFENYTQFGIEAYPFTKEAVIKEEVDRLQRLQLFDLLEGVGICSFFDSNKTPLHPSKLSGANVVLYFSSTTKGGHFSSWWEEYLPNWFKEFKRLEKCFEMICIWRTCVDDKTFFDYCSNKPWLVARNDHAQATILIQQIFGKPWVEDTLVAFGSDGRLLTLYLQDRLGEVSKFATNWFAESRDKQHLDKDVRYMIDLYSITDY